MEINRCCECLTMRPNTERPIMCKIGTNLLARTNPHRILYEADSILDGNTRSVAVGPCVSPAPTRSLKSCCLGLPPVRAAEDLQTQ